MSEIGVVATLHSKSTQQLMQNTKAVYVDLVPRGAHLPRHAGFAQELGEDDRGRLGVHHVFVLAEDRIQPAEFDEHGRAVQAGLAPPGTQTQHISLAVLYELVC